MRSHIQLALATLAFSLRAAAASGSAEACSAFNFTLSDVALNGTTYFVANATVAFETPLSSIYASDLPAFCRLQLVITTNATAGSTAQTELWLPDDWNGRSLTVGNGGWSGGSTSQFCTIMIGGKD